MDKYNELIKKIRRQVPVGESFDLLERKLKIGGKSASMFFVDGLVDGGMMQRVIFSLFSLKPEQVENAKNAQEFLESNMPFLDAMVTEDLQQAITFLYSGLVPLFISGYGGIIIIDCRSYPLRGINEPSKEKSLRGSKDGFVESMMTNIALIRRRIRDNNLIFKIYSVGSLTKSDVSIAYMKDKTDMSMVKKLDGELKKLKIEGLTVTEQTLVERLIGKKLGRFNPFPRVRYTQRPDVIAAHVEEGKIAIIVDNSPTVILVPAGIFDFVQDVDDYYFPMLTGNYFRMLRIANMLVILFATPVYLLFAEGDIPVSYTHLDVYKRQAVSRKRTAPIDYICNEDSTIVFVSLKNINNSRFSKQIYEVLMQQMASDNIKKMHKIEILAEKGLRKRILMYLEILRTKAGSDTVSVKMSREQLAQYLCVNRSALSNELNKMKREKIIDFEKDQFRFL